MSPACSFALGKVIGHCLLIWLVVEAVSWLSDQVAGFIEAYRPYLIAAAVAGLLGLLLPLVRRRRIGQSPMPAAAALQSPQRQRPTASVRCRMGTAGLTAKPQSRRYSRF